MTVNNNSVYIHKENRAFARDRFSHSHFISFFRVLGFNYMGLTCTNLDNIVNDSKAYLLGEERSNSSSSSNKMRDDTNDDSGFVLDYTDELLLDNGISKPIITFLQRDDKISFNYELSSIPLEGFVKYINTTLNSNVATLFQNPIKLICEELNYKYSMYRIFNNLNGFVYDLLPSVYDFLTSEAILVYINGLNKRNL